MSTRLEIDDLCGELVFSGCAEEGWCVHELKRAISGFTGVPCEKQKLINSMGDVLQDANPLYHYFCSAHLDDAERLTFVEMPKTDAEIKHYECWLEDTPKCWQNSTEVVFDCSELAWATRWKYAVSLPFHRPRQEWAFVDPPTPASLKRANPAEAVVEHERWFETSGEIISAAKSGQIIKIKPRGEKWATHPETDSLCNVELSSLRHAWVSSAILFQAIEHAPEIVTHHLDDIDILGAARKIPGIYTFIPDRLKGDRSILYAALECDATLQAEFLHTAGQSEIHAWLWYAEEEGLTVAKKLTKAASSKQRKEQVAAAAAAASAAAAAAAPTSTASTLTKEPAKRPRAKAVPCSGANRRDRLPIGRDKGASQPPGVKGHAAMRLRNAIRSKRA